MQSVVKRQGSLGCAAYIGFRCFVRFGMMDSYVFGKSGVSGVRIRHWEVGALVEQNHEVWRASSLPDWAQGEGVR